MGYTHYWYRGKSLARPKFAAVVADFQKVLPIIEGIGVKLAGWDGEGSPDIRPTVIAFNGLGKCGHPAANLGIAWPSQSAGGVALAAGEKAKVGTWFAGAQIEQRTCGGDCAHETFRIEQSVPASQFTGREERGQYFACCKTAYKPYDLAVTAALVILKHHFGAAIRVTSDGELSHWFDAMLLAHQHLGYGLGFKLDESK